jgi:hypothetical protein
LKDKIKAIDKQMGTQRAPLWFTVWLLLSILMWEINIDECYWKSDVFVEPSGYFGYTVREK